MEEGVEAEDGWRGVLYFLRTLSHSGLAQWPGPDLEMVRVEDSYFVISGSVRTREG